jgi:plastocyanin
MRSIATCLFAGLAVVLSACGGGSGAEPARTATVAIQDFKFKPAAVDVSAGGAVRFVNHDRAEHTATAPGGFDTGGLAKGRSKIVVLRKPGTFVYRCDFHPFMTAKVVVK